MNPQPVMDERSFKEFHENGAVVVKNFFDPGLVKKLADAAKTDEAIKSNAYGRSDGAGGLSKLATFNLPPPNTLYGMFGCSRRLYEAAEQLLGGPVYFYHAKLSMKEAKVGGRWQWHQDFGYWYNHGILFPHMLSVMIALDDCTVENGCLEVLAGSHKMGRCDHQLVGEQAGADPERVALIQESSRFASRHCTMNVGDVFFMHSNTLHCSSKNESDLPRWLYIIAFNRCDNQPVHRHLSPHSAYKPPSSLPDDSSRLVDDKEIRHSSFTGFPDLETATAAFMDPAAAKNKLPPTNENELRE